MCKRKTLSSMLLETQRFKVVVIIVAWEPQMFKT